MINLLALVTVILTLIIFVLIIDRLFCFGSQKYSILKWVFKYRDKIEWIAKNEMGLLCGTIKYNECDVTIELWLKYDIFKNKYYLENIRYRVSGMHININESFHESGSIITSIKIKMLKNWTIKKFNFIIKSKELNLL